MRTALYLSSLFLALPSIALAAAFLVLGNAISAHSLLGFLGVLLESALWLLPWGLLAILAAFVALVLAGFSIRVRWLASLLVALLAIGSSAIAIALIVAHGNGSFAQLAFFVPAAVSAVMGTWLAIREWPNASAGAPPRDA
ncbi:MAG TPA: hypothetical protein VFS15_18005 [Kofleriaceae bacterium]|nr:hypothetical protein [Kofleriaceae bacterium]